MSLEVLSIARLGAALESDSDSALDALSCDDVILGSRAAILFETFATEVSTS